MDSAGADAADGLPYRGGTFGERNAVIVEPVATVASTRHSVTVAMAYGGRSGTMAKGRRWTPEEDRAVLDVAELNRRIGSIGGRGRHGRLLAVADAFGRTYEAVRCRAARLGVTSRW